MSPRLPEERSSPAERALIALDVLLLAAFVFSVLASTALRWHPAITGTCAVVCAVGLVACVAWLNRIAGRGDGEGPE